jgi:hypothetical protein
VYSVSKLVIEKITMPKSMLAMLKAMVAMLKAMVAMPMVACLQTNWKIGSDGIQADSQSKKGSALVLSHLLASQRANLNLKLLAFSHVVVLVLPRSTRSVGLVTLSITILGSPLVTSTIARTWSGHLNHATLSETNRLLRANLSQQGAGASSQRAQEIFELAKTHQCKQRHNLSE